MVFFLACMCRYTVISSIFLFIRVHICFTSFFFVHFPHIISQKDYW